MKELTTVCFWAVLTMAANAQALKRAKLDSLFDHLEAANLGKGSLAISDEGKLIYLRSFGKDQSVAAKYRIGSITKMFTAVLIYQLIDAKKLSLATTLSRFFPQMPNAGKITIANMLGHRSGLANFTNNNTVAFDEWKEQPKTHEALLALITNQPPDFEPGTKADYNNSNYLLLGYVLEAVYAKPYPVIVTDRIIRKIGLTDTYYGLKSGYQPGEAISYHYSDNNWTPDKAVYLDNFGGAGAIISTPSDMCRFITALFAGRLISRQSLATMKNIKDGYGMGLFPYGNEKHAGVGHNGKTEGFGSSLSYYPENKLAIAYCTNGEVYPKSEILDGIFNICFDQPYKMPAFDPVDVPENIRDKYAGKYSSADSNIRVTVTKTNQSLGIETKGQQFAAIPLSRNDFWNKAFGFFFVFSDDGARLRIKTGDSMYELYKY